MWRFHSCRFLSSSETSTYFIIISFIIGVKLLHWHIYTCMLFRLLRLNTTDEKRWNKVITRLYVMSVRVKCNSRSLSLYLLLIFYCVRDGWRNRNTSTWPYAMQKVSKSVSRLFVQLLQAHSLSYTYFTYQRRTRFVDNFCITVGYRCS